MADARLVLRDGRVVENTLRATSRMTASDGWRELAAARADHEVRPADGGPRNARVVAAPAVLLHLHRRRRRRDRRAALGDPERPRRLRRRSQVADRRRRADRHQPRLDRRGARDHRPRVSPRPAPTARTETSRRRRWCGRRIGRRRWRRWRSCARCSRTSRSTAASTLQGGQPYSHALLADHGALVRPELLTALGVAVGDQIADRPGDVHDPRRHRERAGAAGSAASASARA